MMKLLYFLFFYAFVIALDIYAFQSVNTVFKNKKAWKYKVFSFVYWGVTVFVFLSFFAYFLLGQEKLPINFRIISGSLFFIFLLSKLFAIVWLLSEDVYRFFEFLIRKVKGENNISIKSRREAVSKIAIASAMIPFSMLTYGIVVNGHRFQFRNQKIKINNLPKAFEGFKIVQLSDIHAGSFTRMNPIKKVVEKINALNPDLVVFTGDLVNDLAREMDVLSGIFGNLKAKYGVLSITGNHDYADYYYGRGVSTEKEENFKAFLKVHENMGWDLLRNEHRIIQKDNEKLAIVGVENWGKSQYFPRYGDMEEAIKGCENIPTKILLSHDPSHWDEEILPKYKDIALTLSGHTHGFQFGIETKKYQWSPAQYAYPRWAGLYEENNQQIYVNRGFGFTGYPGRLGILSEVTVIELIS